MSSYDTYLPLKVFTFICEVEIHIHIDTQPCEVRNAVKISVMHWATFFSVCSPAKRNKAIEFLLAVK